MTVTKTHTLAGTELTSETVRPMLDFFKGYARLSGFLSSKPAAAASRRGHAIAFECVRDNYQHHSS